MIQKKDHSVVLTKNPTVLVGFFCRIFVKDIAIFRYIVYDTSVLWAFADGHEVNRIGRVSIARKVASGWEVALARRTPEK